MGDITDTRTNWLDPNQLELVRGQVPLVYIDAIPVRVNELGVVTHVGMLLRQAPDGSISRTIVSGRVLLNERIREALLRHLEKDLGPMALPKIPSEPAPFTIVEYFTDANNYLSEPFGLAPFFSIMKNTPRATKFHFGFKYDAVVPNNFNTPIF